MARLWIVRAGKHGEREAEALEQGQLLPGFQEADDLRPYQTRDAILMHLKDVLPDDGINRLRNFAAQLNQFVNVIAAGDLVVMPRKFTDGVAIGEVTGDYVFDGNSPHRHMRPVKWLAESIPRSQFKVDLQHSFGAFMTICEVSRHDALNRVRSVLAGNADPGPYPGQRGKVEGIDSANNEGIEDYAADIEELAHQQIVLMIKSEFAGHALADLVAEILQVEGYTTTVSPPGPDAGVDILAAGGTLGLGEDRICVQVKSGDGAANHDVVLRLIGAVANSQARTGLLVSLGGVNSAARKELEKNFFSLRLWQMPELLKALFRTYGELSEETRSKLPLKQIWAPASAHTEQESM